MDINIGSIRVGAIYKNLKELCNVLDLEYKDSTNSRKALIKNIESHMDLERQGNKYIVKKIHSTPIAKIDNRGKAQGSRSNNSVYVKNIDILVRATLLDTLENMDYFHTSTSGILGSIDITQDTFTDNLEEIDRDCYLNAKLKLSSTLNSMVTSSLNRINKQGYIYLKEGYVVVEKDIVRLANIEETLAIITKREQLLKELNIKPVQLLLNERMRYDFYIKLKERVAGHTYSLKDIQAIYKGYRIEINRKVLSIDKKANIEENREQLIDLIKERVF